MGLNRKNIYKIIRWTLWALAGAFSILAASGVTIGKGKKPKISVIKDTIRAPQPAYGVAQPEYGVMYNPVEPMLIEPAIVDTVKKDSLNLEKKNK